MAFSFIIIAIMLNMFIAIVMNAYDDYKMEGDDLFGFYDVKLSFIIFVTKTKKALYVLEKIYTENETMSLTKDEFMGVIRKACQDLSTGGFYPPDIKNVIKYVDIILRHDKTLKKFENHYFMEHSCNIKFKSLKSRRKKCLAALKAKSNNNQNANSTNNNGNNNGNNNSSSSSSSGGNNNNSNNNSNGIVATTKMVNDALASDNSGIHSRGLNVRGPSNNNP